MRRRIEVKESQQDTVKAALLAGERLNQVMMLKAYGGDKAWRLGGIIYALANDKKEPWIIEREYTGANGMATYWIPKGFKPGGPVQLGLPL
jgi:hypothetical protein